ncbi:MAG: acyltransferase family protein [Sphingomonadales bacterium]|jgi:hypothetical protein
MNTRRYDLDWLRIIAFGLLIFYHVGMFYVSWDWHVKSIYAGDGAEPFMKLLNPWRLPLLFFISGVALRFAFDKYEDVKAAFIRGRVKQLLIPILFGMAVIVYPQSWAELTQGGEITASFWNFYPTYIQSDFSNYSVIIPTYNHLWYVVYLLIYTCIFALFTRPLGFIADRIVARIFAQPLAPLWALVLPLLPHVIYAFTLNPHYPYTHAVVGDWANHAHSFTLVLTGYVVAKDAGYWRAIQRLLPFALTIAVVLGALSLEFDMLRSLYAWAVIASLLGLAQKYLNHDGPVRRYMTEAIFPWYILHQTLTVMAGFWLTKFELGLGIEFALITLATFGGCALIYEFGIRRFPLLRPLFGLKSQASPAGTFNPIFRRVPEKFRTGRSP